ncbi:MAG TPA: hypothetical protein VFQ77_00795 [Pseudonocardiaceae bacterium]|nr:hypothetical protein [Pseudonocardiaceae bacterium]
MLLGVDEPDEHGAPPAELGDRSHGSGAHQQAAGNSAPATLEEAL